MLLLLAACTEPPAEADAFVAPEAPANGLQLHVPPVEVAPGTEVERCLWLPGTHAADAWVSRFELVAREGLHHAMLVKAPEEREAEEDCFGLPEDLMDDYSQVPEPMFASSTQVTEETVEFPAGVAVPLAAHQPMLVNYHLLNTTDAPITGEVFVNLHFAEPGSAPEAARLYAMGNLLGIDIPAQGEQTLTTTCVFPRDANLLSLTPHMHQRGRSFRAAIVPAAFTDAPGEERAVLDTAAWSNPETTWFAPAMAVAAGDALRFTCAWTNDGDTAVHFGPSADDEMCMVFGYHWPSDDLLWRADYDEEACTSG